MTGQSFHQFESKALQTRRLIDMLFDPSDLIELRLIETWRQGEKNASKLFRRHWLVAREIQRIREQLERDNRRGANVFFGVNPRSGAGGSKKHVVHCRALWADLDDARPGDQSRWQSLPQPTLIVDSGRGVHLYWKLATPYSLASTRDRERLEQLLKGIYTELNADSVQDVARLLRLPGFDNVKDWRNGRPPVPCRIVNYEPNARHSTADFERYRPQPLEHRESCLADSGDVEFPRAEKDLRRIRGLLRLLGEEAEDRSGRDFYVVTKLLALGCTPSEIALMVADQSKFLNNKSYLTRTIANALRITRTRS